MSEIESGTASVIDPQLGQTKLRPRAISDKFDSYDRTFPKIESFFDNVIDDVEFETEHASEDLEIPHTLGTIPTDVIVGLPSQGAGFRRGQKEWTKDHIYMRSDSACTVRLYVVA